MKFIPNAVSRKVAMTVLKTQKNSPHIMFAAGIAGSITSTVLACRSTLRLEEVLKEAQDDFAKVRKVASSPDSRFSEEEIQQAKLGLYIRSAAKVAKLYAPAVTVGAISFGLLFSSHRVLTKRNAALTVAYAGLLKSFNEYRARVIEAVGEDKELEIRYAMEDRDFVEDTPKGPKVVNSKVPTAKGESIYAKFFAKDTSSSWTRRPEENRIFIQMQQEYANGLLNSRGYVMLNEVYKSLGLEPTSAGAVVGWVRSNEEGAGDGYVDFGIFNHNDPAKRAFVNGAEGSILLDFNVDGVVYDKIDQIKFGQGF